MVDDESIFDNFDFQQWSAESELAAFIRSAGGKLLASHKYETKSKENDHKGVLDF